MPRVGWWGARENTQVDTYRIIAHDIKREIMLFKDKIWGLEQQMKDAGFRRQEKNILGQWVDHPFTKGKIPEVRYISDTSCGYVEPESEWRDPDTGEHRLARCEGGKLVVRGNGLDSKTDGSMWISTRECPRCAERAI